MVNLLNVEAMFDVRLKQPIAHDMYIKIADKDIRDKFINYVTQVKLFRIRSLMEYQNQLALAEHLIGVLEEKY